MTAGDKTERLTYVDLSHSIADGDRPYPGDPPTVVRQWSSLGTDHFRLKHMSFGSHSSTHMDSPSHLVAEGKTLDSIDLFSFFHEAFVLDARAFSSIGIEQVRVVPEGITAVLFFTGWQDWWNSEQYFEDPPLLTQEATLFLLGQGIRLFGFDSPSCDAAKDESLPIHHLVFSYDGLILENLNNLDRVVERRISLVALPLLVEDSDGCPTRVIASYKS